MTSDQHEAQRVLLSVASNRSDSGVERSVGSAEYQRLCRQLRTFRLQAGLTQRELADRINESQGFVSDYERGQRRLDVFELRQIVEAIGPAAEAVTALLRALDAVMAALGRDEPPST